MADHHLPTKPTELVATLQAASRRLEASVGHLDDHALAAPTDLPGWSRGHIVAHLTHNANAFLEVTSAALAGNQRETYPGGSAVRDSAIERDASHPATQAIAELRAAHHRLHELWASLNDGDWQSPVLFRSGVIAHLLAARWREVEIHHTDLDVDYPPSRWSPEFSHHAIAFLLPRLETAAVELVATDTGESWQPGSQRMGQVRGKAHEIAAWLAGRASTTRLEISAAQAPALGPWP